jgi:nucleotide-binding universal stress UspA family protein
MSGRPVLIPLDGSELAEGAIAYARSIARATDAELVFFTAFRQVEIAASEQRRLFEEDGRARFTSYLEDVRQHEAHPSSQIAVAFGRPADEIVQTSQKMNVAMVVMASHGRSGVGRWAYGSTTWSVVHQTEIPVMIVNHAALLPIDAEVTFKHVLVPLDGSPMAEAALPLASELAHAFGARASVAQVVHPSVEAYPSTMPPVRYVDDLDEKYTLKARDYLESRGHSFAPRTDVAQHVLYGSTADELMKLVESAGVDLVIMTTHARSSLARAMIGSVAERMLHAPVPVVLVPPPN